MPGRHVGGVLLSKCCVERLSVGSSLGEHEWHEGGPAVVVLV